MPAENKFSRLCLSELLICEFLGKLCEHFEIHSGYIKAFQPVVYRLGALQGICGGKHKLTEGFFVEFHPFTAKVKLLR